MTAYLLKTYSDEHKINATSKIVGVFTDRDKLVDTIIANRNEFGLDGELTDFEIEVMVYQNIWRLNSELLYTMIELYEANVYEREAI